MAGRRGAARVGPVMGQAIGQVLSLAGVALSPVPIIAVVLMVGTPRGRSAASPARGLAATDDRVRELDQEGVVERFARDQQPQVDAAEQ
jgi:hypothetical protein